MEFEINIKQWSEYQREMVFIYVALSLCNSFKKSQRNSFLVVLEKKFTTPLLDQYKVKSGLSCPLTGPNTGQIHFLKK